MARYTALMICTLTGTAICLLEAERVQAQSCGQRRSAPGLNSLINSPAAAPLTGLQQPLGLNPLAALQQQQAAAQAIRLQQEQAVLAARRQQLAAAQAEKRANEQGQRATTYRELGDRFRDQQRIAQAIQNYRRAVAAAPGTRDALAAQAELDSYQADAELKLFDIQERITARDWEQASTRLNELKRDYGKLQIGSRINAAISRVTRSKGQSQSVSAEIAERSSPLIGVAGNGTSNN